MERLKERKPSCNKDLMSGFGLIGENLKTYSKMNTYCFKNNESCCTNHHLESIRFDYLKAIKKIEANFSNMREMLVLVAEGELF